MKRLAMGILFFFIFLAGISYFNNRGIPRRQPTQTVAKQQTPVQKIQELKDLYRKVHPHPDQYWLTGLELNPSRTDSKEVSDYLLKMDTFEKDVMRGLRRYVDADFLCGEILGEFPEFRLTEVVRAPPGFVGYSSQNVHPESNREEALRRFEKQSRLEVVEVAVISQNIWKQGEFTSQLYYNKQWRAVMVVGVEIPELFRTAVLYHELGHAMFHKRGAPSATAPTNSDKWVEEEAMLHFLEHQVLEFGSNGEFNKLLDTIANRAANPRDVNQVIMSVTVEDLIAYDKIFNLEKVGYQLAGLTLAQFLMSIGFRVIENGQYPEPDRLKRMMVYYRFITPK